MIIDQFDEMLSSQSAMPLVCGIALHTMVMGSPIGCARCAAR